jgi:hypothetical protein
VKTTAEIINMMESKRVIEAGLMALRHENTSDAVAFLSEAVERLRWREQKNERRLHPDGFKCYAKDKPLTLEHLKRQVDAAVELQTSEYTTRELFRPHTGGKSKPGGGLHFWIPGKEPLWEIGDFEIRRRK